jgi:hypothetical protein
VADVVPKAAKIDRHTLCIARGAVIPQHTLLGACLATRAGDERASAPLVRRFLLTCYGVYGAVRLRKRLVSS